MQALSENPKSRPPAETSQSTETLNRVICRLYPSLPNRDGYDFCEVEKQSTAAESHSDRPQEVSQSGDSPPITDVRLKAQILLLEEQRKQLLSINEKWSKEYEFMVQYYKEKIRILKASQEHEEEKCDKGQQHIALVKNQRVKLVYDEDRSKTEKHSSELLQAEAETEALRLQNHRLTRRGQHQHEEIRRLNKALEDMVQNSQYKSASSEQTANIWEHQAQVYKEDFFKERKDREKLKEKNLELEKRFRKVQYELHTLKSQVTLAKKPQPALHCHCIAAHQSPNWEVHQYYTQKQRCHALCTKQ